MKWWLALCWRFFNAQFVFTYRNISLEILEIHTEDLFVQTICNKNVVFVLQLKKTKKKKLGYFYFKNETHIWQYVNSPFN